MHSKNASNSNITIFVVDDDAELVEVLSHSLVSAGFVVHTAHTADQALALFKNHKKLVNPGLTVLLTDWNIGNENAAGLLDYVLATSLIHSTLIISGGTDLLENLPDYLSKFKSKGLRLDALVKPFKISALKDVIDNLVEVNALQKAVHDLFQENKPLQVLHSACKTLHLPLHQLFEDANKQGANLTPVQLLRAKEGLADDALSVSQWMVLCNLLLLPVDSLRHPYDQEKHLHAVDLALSNGQVSFFVCDALKKSLESMTQALALKEKRK